MLKSTFIPGVIKTLENNKTKISELPNVEVANEIFIEMFHPQQQIGTNEFVLQNIHKLLIHFLYELKVPIDHVIAHLKTLFVNSYDDQTNLREAEDDFDKKHGTITSLIQEQFELNEPIPIQRLLNAAKHHPSPVSSMYLALKSVETMNVDFTKTSFIDIGSGMGRSILIASEFSFNEIIGIEISKSLHAISKRNIDVYTNEHQKCDNIRLVCDDVLKFDFPQTETLILYFWEPFSAEIFDKLYLKLRDMEKSRKQKIILIFLGKVFSTIKNSSKFKIVDIIKTPDKVRTVDISDRQNVENTDYYYLSIYSN